MTKKTISATETVLNDDYKKLLRTPNTRTINKTRK